MLLEREHIVVQHVLVLLESFRCLDSAVKHAHEVVGVRLVGPRLIVVLEVLADVVQVLLDAVPPGVARAELLQLLLRKGAKVQLSVAVQERNFLGSCCLDIISWSIDLVQVHSEIVTTAEQQGVELLLGQVLLASLVLLRAVLESKSFLQVDADPNFIQAIEQILSRDVSLVLLVPLVENFVDVGARGILAAQHAADVLDHGKVDGLVA